ncbi:hypothetical protein GUJ93_ZPchr0001g31206 [Zizania palustris]|uniref:Uncharacterized protein n=1 Tax=Zizania palustris TaxID=103762 RepID=A0A8J5VM26_ZIZPA|nr:hypothetical protein GUJ93_ZPchr0001g31206 [Zizania palustris]
MLSHVIVMRKLEGSIFPIGLSKESSDRNHKVGSNVLVLESRARDSVGLSVDTAQVSSSSAHSKLQLSFLSPRLWNQ